MTALDARDAVEKSNMTIYEACMSLSCGMDYCSPVAKIHAWRTELEGSRARRVRM